MIRISEGLTVWNEKMEAVPVLAEVIPSPENGLARVLEDGRLEVTWKLRPGIRWHDGEPFDSRDVAFTVETINDPGYNPESTEGFDLDRVGRDSRRAHRRRYLSADLRGVPGPVLERRPPAPRSRGKGLECLSRVRPKAHRDRSVQGGGMENGGVPPPRAKRRLLAGSAQRLKKSSSASWLPATRA